MEKTLSVFIQICPPHCERNSAHNVRRFPPPFSLCPTLLVITWKANQKIAVRIRSNFFSNFDHFYSPFNPVFYFELKNIKIFKIEPKLTFLHDVFLWNYFFGESIPNFLPGMRGECEKFSEFIQTCPSQCGQNVKSL